MEACALLRQTMLLLANKCNQYLSPCAQTYNLSLWLIRKIQNKTLKTIRKFMTACKFPYLFLVKFKHQLQSIFWKYISNFVNNERINTLHRPICLQETQILDTVMLKFLLIEGKHLSRYYIILQSGDNAYNFSLYRKGYITIWLHEYITTWLDIPKLGFLYKILHAFLED